MTNSFITVNGVQIRYRDTGGQGVPIVLTHGIGGSLELWGPQLDTLGKTHRLIAWDVPNHGLSGLTGRLETWESYADWYLDFADALGLDHFIAAGNSMGGALSLRIAALAPHRVRGVFLANAASLGREVFPVFRLMTLPLLGELMNKPSQKGVDMALSAIVKDKSCVSADLRAAMLRNQFKEGGAAAFVSILRACTNVFGQRADTWQKSAALLAQLDVPMVILHGRQDAVLPLKHSEEAAKMARRAQLIVLEDCGHTPQIEKPAEFNAALTAFAAKLAA
jgi:pimeloyl-ACP methyl ester carboxylesterase